MRRTWTEPRTAITDAVRAFLDAVETGDIDAVLDRVTDDVAYENVPHGAVHGKAGLRAMLGPFLARCERVRWDVVAVAVGADLAFVERVDRFWIDGDEYKIECCGVYRIRDGLVANVRDYVDLSVWRRRLGAVMDTA